MSSLAFGLFLLLNFVLWVRPMEIVPPLVGVSLYEYLILPLLLIAFPYWVVQLFPGNLIQKPATALVLVLLALNVLVLLPTDAAEAFRWGEDFFKVVLYYLLFIGLVTTPARLKTFLGCLLFYVLCIAAVTVLEFHGVIEVANIKALRESHKDLATGEQQEYVRLLASGIFADPNELCTLLVVGVFLCLYRMTEPSAFVARLAGLPILGLFMYTLVMTQSRGGLLALVGAIVLFFLARFRGRTALLLGLVTLPGLFLAVTLLGGSRQTQISTADGTAQDRIQIWSDGLQMLRDSHLLGVGRNQYVENAGLVAHNSFVHAFGELGFVGGACFLGGFLLALGPLLRLGSRRVTVLDPDLRRMRPYLVAVLGGYVCGMMTLTLTYLVPTYMLMALGTAYVHMARTDPPAWGRPVLSGKLLGGVALCAALFLGVTYVFVRAAMLRG